VAVLVGFSIWNEAGSMPLLGLPGQVSPNGLTGVISNDAGFADHSFRQTAQRGGLVIDVSLNYPSLGNAIADADIKRWATGIAEAFVENLCEDASDNGAARPGEGAQSYALHGSYTVSRPSAAVVSLTFELWTYTGGAHGNLDIITLNYSLLNGQRLELADLFEEPDEALKLMSDWSFQTLSRRFAGAWTLQMLKDGTSPDTHNFASLTLTPEGLVIQFQPYQVVPWAAGAQTVEMLIERLASAGPLSTVWGVSPSP
jgi:hypothetical protein